MDLCGEKMYEVSKSGARITFANVKDFNLEHIFDCGQCFRWKKESDSTWYGVVGQDFARISYIADEPESANSPTFMGTVTGTVIIESTNNDEKFWIKYLDLDRDYSEIKKQLSKDDPIMEEAIKSGWGIRILKQDEWETVISFIVSQNSNIPRIKGCIEALCREYGKEIGEYRGEKIFSFPDMKTLASQKESDLQACRLGYRAKYIAEAARQINRDDGAVLEVTSSMDDISVVEYLKGISGIGPKVASCIMLFSMGKLNIFPIDVWVKRVMNRLYGISEDNLPKMKEYANEHFGKYGGIAQQYLFYYIRNLAEEKPDLYNTLNVDESKTKVSKITLESDNEDDKVLENNEEPESVAFELSDVETENLDLADNDEQVSDDDENKPISEVKELREEIINEEQISDDKEDNIVLDEEEDILDILSRDGEDDSDNDDSSSEDLSSSVIKGMEEFNI